MTNCPLGYSLEFSHHYGKKKNVKRLKNLFFNLFSQKKNNNSKTYLNHSRTPIHQKALKK